MNTKDLASLKVAFRSDLGTYLCADRDSPLVTAIKSIGEWECWTIIPLDDEYTEFAIRSFHNKYLCSRGANEGATVDQSTNLGSWERFKLVVNLNNDIWSIQSVAHGSYVRTKGNNSTGNPVDLQTYIGHCEEFKIEIISQPIEVNNFKYNLDWSDVISEKLTTIYSAEFKNNSSTPSKLERNLRDQKQISFTFMQTYGSKIKSTKLFAKIPEVIDTDGDWTSRSRLTYNNKNEWDWTSGSKLTYGTNLTYGFVTSTIVNPGDSVNVSIVATKRQIRIPWKATAIYNVDNREIKKYIGGIWEGTVYCNLHTRTD